MKLSVTLLASWRAAMAAHAEVYKWVDEDGNVHFTDTPPPKQEDRRGQDPRIESSRKFVLDTRASPAVAVHPRPRIARSAPRLFAT